MDLLIGMDAANSMGHEWVMKPTRNLMAVFVEADRIGPRRDFVRRC